MDTDRAISNSLFVAAGEIMKRHEETLTDAQAREQSAKMVKEIAGNLESHFSAAIQVAVSGEKSPEVALRDLISEIRRALTGMRGLGENLTLDSHRIRGQAEGLASAARGLEEMGAARKRDAESSEVLAASNADLERRRKLGERPESLRVKRKAAEIRENLSTDKEDER